MLTSEAPHGVSRRLLTDLLPSGQPVTWLRAPRGKLCAVPIDSWRLAFGGMELDPGIGPRRGSLRGYFVHR